MAFISVPAIARYVMGLVFTTGLALALAGGPCAAQTKAAGHTAGAAGTQEAQDQPDTDAARNGDSQAAKASQPDTQERDRRLLLLRLLVQGGGSYRPFGLFR